MNKLYEETYISDIADAIRAKNGSDSKYTVSEMAGAILSLSGDGGITPTGELKVTANGTYDVTNYASVLVDILGGSSSNPSGVFVGTITVESDSSSAITVAHGVGKTPDIVFVFPTDTTATTNSTAGGVYVKGTTTGISCNTSNAYSYNASVQSIQNVTDTSFDFAPRSASYAILAGQYVYIAM